MPLLLPAFAVASALLAAPPKPFTQGPSVEGVTEYDLPNGLKVLLLPDDSVAQVTVNLTVFAGSRNADYGEHGMAHLFEHMLFKRTKKIADVKKTLSDLGGAANGTTAEDRTNFYETFPADPKHLRVAIELESQRLSAAVVSREQLATEMTVVRNEFELGENNPDMVLSQRVESAAYGWHNYGKSVIGARSDIEQVPTERLQAFYKRYYTPDNAMLVVAGKFDTAQALGFIAHDFGPLPRAKEPRVATYTVEPAQDGERAVTVRRVGGVPTLVLAYHVPAGTDPDAAPLDVLSTALGATPAGRLHHTLVDSKKAAWADCYLLRRREPGLLECETQLTAGDPVGPAREALLDAVEGGAPFTEADVERAKNLLAKRTEDVLIASDRIGMVLSEGAAQGDWRMLFWHRDAVAKVTLADVTRVAARYLKPSNRTLGEYVPSPTPDHVEIPGPVDLPALMATYTPKAARDAGEAFDASPANLDARTHRITLPPGMQVALLPKRTRGGSVHARLAFRFGSLAALDGQEEAMRCLGSMLSRGTAKMTRTQLSDTLDRLKASVYFTVDGQALVVDLEVRRPNLLEALDLIADVVRTPALDPTEFETFRRETIGGLEQAADDPSALGGNRLGALMQPYPPGHPYHVPTFQDELRDLRAMGIADLKVLHTRFIGAQNASVGVVGDFDEAEVTAALTRQYAGFTAKEPYVRIPRPYMQLAPGQTSYPLTAKASVFLGAAQSVRMKDTDPEFPAMVMADYMLGGGFLAGRLPQRLREKDGLSYAVGSQFEAGEQNDFALFLVYATFAPANTAKVEQGLVDELARAVKDGFTDAELKAAKLGWKQAQLEALADDTTIAASWVEYLPTGRTFAYDADLQAKVAALTVADVNAAVRKHLDPKALGIVTAGDVVKTGK